MDFYEVIRTRRSIRSYQEKAISEDILNKVLDAARIAPSGSNRQPWRFIVTTDSQIKQELAQLCHGQSFIAQAPVVITACGSNLRHNRGDWMGDYSMLVDVAIAFDHLTLAARAEGLGTCWIGSFKNEEIKQLLNIPEDMQVVAITPLGYPQEEQFREVDDRKPLSEIISQDKFK